MRALDHVVMPSGSCASMVRVFYKELFHDDPALLERAVDVGSHVFELSEFLVDVLGVDGASEPTRSRYASTHVTYHEACHLEAGTRRNIRKRGSLINQTHWRRA